MPAARHRAEAQAHPIFEPAGCEVATTGYQGAPAEPLTG
jgi:hypothetical protein